MTATGAPPSALNTNAIVIGSVVGIAGSLVMALFWRLVPVGAAVETLWVVMLISQASGVLIDIATGAVAGWIARARGSMHGLFAGLIANILSLGIGYGMTLLTTDFGRTSEDVLRYLMAVLPWQVMGVAIASLSGAIAVRLRARSDAA